MYPAMPRRRDLGTRHDPAVGAPLSTPGAGSRSYQKIRRLGDEAPHVAPPRDGLPASPDTDAHHTLLSAPAVGSYA